MTAQTKQLKWKRVSPGYYESACGQCTITRMRSQQTGKADEYTWAIHIDKRIVRDADTLAEAKSLAYRTLNPPIDGPTSIFNGILEIDHNRGVIYFHANETGTTLLRICGLGTIPHIRQNGKITAAMDLTHMYGFNVSEHAIASAPGEWTRVSSN